MAVVASESISATPQRSKTPLVVAAVGVVLVIAIIVAGVWFVHWRSSLRLFASYPDNGFGTDLSNGQTAYIGNNLTDARVYSEHSTPGHLEVHISSVTPVINDNTAHATVRVMRCVLSGEGGGPIGYRAEVDSVCSALTPFRSGSLTLGFTKGSDDLVLAVTSHGPGRVRIAGVDVHYSAGLRHGSQHTGLQITTTTRR